MLTTLTVLTDSHRELYEEHFLKSLPSDVDLRVRSMELAGTGAYGSSQWQRGVVEKLHFALAYADENEGTVFVFSDVDIQFFAGFSMDLLRDAFEKSGCDVLFQRESANEQVSDVNTGFYIARSTAAFRDLLREAVAICEGQAVANDQVAVNAILSSGACSVRWGHLGLRHYSRTHGFPPPRDIVMHHATMTKSVAEKVAQLHAIRAYIEGGRLKRLKVLACEGFGRLLRGEIGGVLLRKLGRMRKRRANR